MSLSRILGSGWRHSILNCPQIKRLLPSQRFSNKEDTVPFLIQMGLSITCTGKHLFESCLFQTLEKQSSLFYQAGWHNGLWSLFSLCRDSIFLCNGIFCHCPLSPLECLTLLWNKLCPIYCPIYLYILYHSNLFNIQHKDSAANRRPE